MLSTEQRASFAEHGLLRLPGLAEPHVLAALRERVFGHLREQGILPDPAPPGFSVTPSQMARVVNDFGFEEVWGKAALACVDELLGIGTWTTPKHAGQLLFLTFPLEGAAWQLPHKVWHLDYPAPGALRGLPGVQLFLCVERVTPRAGGTLVACGSHRLIDGIRRREGTAFSGRSAEVRRRLRAEVPWLRELWSLRAGEDREARFMSRPTDCGGVPLQVVELCGDAGDGFVMHPWLLHAPSPNCGDGPRLVLTERIRTRGVGT